MTDPSPVDPDDDALTSVARVNRMLGRGPDEADDPSVLEAVEAVNTLVPTWRQVPAAGWAAHQHYGATILAARFYRRKDSPGGMVNFGDAGGASYVSGNWPDVAMMLGIGTYAVGRVG